MNGFSTMRPTPRAWWGTCAGGCGRPVILLASASGPSLCSACLGAIDAAGAPIRWALVTCERGHRHDHIDVPGVAVACPQCGAAEASRL